MSNPKLTAEGIRRLRQIQRQLRHQIRTKSAGRIKFDMMSWGRLMDPENHTDIRIPVPLSCTSAACMAGHLVLNAGALFVPSVSFTDGVVTHCVPANGGEMLDIETLGIELLFGHDSFTTRYACEDLFCPDSELWERGDMQTRLRYGPRNAIKVINSFIRKYS